MMASSSVPGEEGDGERDLREGCESEFLCGHWFNLNTLNTRRELSKKFVSLPLFFFLVFFRAAPSAYGGFQARGQMEL